MASRTWDRLVVGLALTLCLACGAQSARAEGLWDVYKLARENDPQFKAAEAALEAARQARPKAMASILPSVVASGSSALDHFDDKTPVIDSKTGLPTSGHQYDSQKYGSYLSQPLVNLKYLAGLFQATQRLEEAEAVFQNSRTAIMVKVLERYLNFLSAEEKLHWVRAERQALAQGLARSRRSGELGLVSPLAEQRAMAASDLAEADEIADENQMENTRGELRELTGQTIKGLVRLRPALELAPPSPNPLELWQRLALELNSIVQARDHAWEGARLEVLCRRRGTCPL